MAVTKALSDENRVRMLMVISQGELCVCQIIGIFGLSPSTTSKHLSILYQAGLLDCRKNGRWAHYRLPGKDAPQVILEAVEWITKAASGEPQMAEDIKRLHSILKVDPQTLCKQQQCRK